MDSNTPYMVKIDREYDLNPPSVSASEEGEGEDDPPLVPRLGTRTGSTLLFSTTTRFSDMKQKRNYSFLTSRSIAKTSYTIRSSGVLLQTGRVFFNDIHSRGQILYGSF